MKGGLGSESRVKKAGIPGKKGYDIYLVVWNFELKGLIGLGVEMWLKIEGCMWEMKTTWICNEWLG